MAQHICQAHNWSKMMKINLEFEGNEAVLDLMDGLFMTFLKDFKKRIKEYNEKAKHPDDIAMNNELINAATVILEYYGENDGTN